jgi:hypothetical protein
MKIAFDEETLITLRKLKSAIEDLPHPYHDIFLLLFFSILEECSFTSKDGQFLRLERDKKTSNPIDAMNIKIAQVEEDVRRMNLFSSDRYTGFIRHKIQEETHYYYHLTALC